MAPSELLRALVRSSLFRTGQVYGERGDGSLEYEGKRPSSRWEGHGFTPNAPLMLDGGRVRRVVVWKHRWRVKGTSQTCHSRPPDDVSVRACSLIVVLCLWSWLGSDKGLHNRQLLLDECCSERTIQRWKDRAQTRALESQQATRRAVEERCKPRPVEIFFPGGLSPPEGLMRRRWQAPTAIAILWQALAILLGGAVELDVAVALLLVEARGRWEPQDSPFPI